MEQSNLEKNGTQNPILKTKNELITNIKEWIQIDSEITNMNSEIKNKKNKKKQLTTSLLTIMKSNSIDCFDINGGSLVYKQKKTKKTITGKFLLEQLKQHYKEQPELAKELTQQILENREAVIKEEITMKKDK